MERPQPTWLEPQVSLRLLNQAFSYDAPFSHLNGALKRELNECFFGTHFFIPSIQKKLTKPLTFRFFVEKELKNHVS